jgi:hypothetical protein
MADNSVGPTDTLRFIARLFLIDVAHRASFFIDVAHRASFSTNRSDTYRSPASGKIATMTARSRSEATCRAPEERGPARRADEQSFFAREAANQRVRFFSRGGEMSIGERGIVNCRHDRRRHVLEPLQAVERRVRLDRDQRDVRHLFTQTPARADERAAGAEAGDEVREPALGLLQNLRSRRREVRAPVRRVAVLIRIEVPERLAIEIARTRRIAPSLPSIGSVSTRSAP